MRVCGELRARRSFERLGNIPFWSVCRFPLERSQGQIAFDMFDADKKHLGNHSKLDELRNWKRVFDAIYDPKLSSVDKSIIKRVENTLESNNKIKEDIEVLSRSLQIIIREQERFNSNIYY